MISVLFVDLVGFTGRAETLDPEDVRAILTPYYERVREELQRHGGTVEKFIGDAVMASSVRRLPTATTPSARYEPHSPCGTGRSRTASRCGSR